ncbi:MAG: PEP/pyruvate-binding domain-containing protein [Methylocystaceae bacterium]
MTERISTGLSGLDPVIDYLRLGDNVVWQVDRLEDYAYFARQFANQAHNENRRLVYLRFGQHEPLIENADMVYNLDAELGFEGFSSRVYQIATQEGRGVFYIFDSLSELVSTWTTDLMVGNFFRITCPYLYELDTVAYFTILRGQNSYQTIARIRETTQLFLDLYQVQQHMYIHPLKVYNRYSPTMYLPHIQNGSTFDPITNSLEAARLFTRSNQTRPGDTGRQLDYWDKVFLQAEQSQNTDIDPEQEQLLVERLARMMLGRDERILELARYHFNLNHLIAIRHRMIGSGFIGGKSVGMLLARAILEQDTSLPWQQYLEPHDSFYIGSDVYYTFLIENDCWGLLQQVRKHSADRQTLDILRARIVHGKIPEAVSEQFQYLLDYFGQSPIIVRSSSLLEDSYNSAFAGKYQSVFCANQGSPAERLQNFFEAVRQVYASTIDINTLVYLDQRGLSGLDEQMGLLVQRVSGANHDRYFFPDLAGVGLSCNPYIWHPKLDPDAGLLRLVFGMGTRAVDRVDEDYPLIASLDHPELQPVSSPEDTHRYSQHLVDVIDLQNNKLVSLPLTSFTCLKEEIRIWHLIASRASRLASRLSSDEIWVLDFRQLFPIVRFWKTMQRLLKVLESNYGHPVEVEFTINTNLNRKTFNLNLLQCRPFGINNQKGTILNEEPITREPQTIMATQGHTMGGNRSHAVDALIYVVPEQYAGLPLTDRYQVARLVGQLNRALGQRGLTFMLAGPGRWGTSTPSLGVPVSFAEINHASILTEIAFISSGFTPELSFGTHFFHDLVEADIFYLAVFPEEDQAIYNQNLLIEAPNNLVHIIPSAEKYETVIKVLMPAAGEQVMWFTARLSDQSAYCWVASTVNKG